LIDDKFIEITDNYFFTINDYKTFENISKNEMTDNVEAIFPEIKKEFTSLFASLSLLDEQLELVGETDDESIMAAFAQDIDTLASEHVTRIAPFFDNIASVENGYLPQLEVSSFFEINGQWSLFSGNPTNGEQTGGTFVFAETYDFMTTLTSNNNICFVAGQGE
jgi:hypothetical protein